MNDRLVPKLLTTKGVCEALGICARTLQSHIQAGLLAYIAVGRSPGRKLRMFHPADDNAFIDARRITKARATPARRSRSNPAALRVIDFTSVRNGRSKRLTQMVPLPAVRLLTRAQAASYCGHSLATFERTCPVTPISLSADGRLDRRLLRYDALALNDWIDILSGRAAGRPEAIDRASLEVK